MLTIWFAIKGRFNNNVFGFVFNVLKKTFSLPMSILIRLTSIRAIYKQIIIKKNRFWNGWNSFISRTWLNLSNQWNQSRMPTLCAIETINSTVLVALSFCPWTRQLKSWLAIKKFGENSPDAERHERFFNACCCCCR